MADFILHFSSERFFDFLGADAVEINGVGEVILHGLQLHRVGFFQLLDDVVVGHSSVFFAHTPIITRAKSGSVAALQAPAISKKATDEKTPQKAREWSRVSSSVKTVSIRG